MIGGIPKISFDIFMEKYQDLSVNIEYWISFGRIISYFSCIDYFKIWTTQCKLKVVAQLHHNIIIWHRLCKYARNVLEETEGFGQRCTMIIFFNSYHDILRKEVANTVQCSIFKEAIAYVTTKFYTSLTCCTVNLIFIHLAVSS